MNYLVRVGVFGQVGRFRSDISLQLDYGCKVICRTARGLEVGNFLSEIDETVSHSPAGVHPPKKTVSGNSAGPDGTLLRTMTEQDHLLAERLEKNKQSAIEDCQRLIQSRNLPVVLMDAEQTFDGQNLYFFFLGDITDEVDAMTTELAEAYDSVVKFSEFADTLANGCGPDCGTEKAANGCGTSGCSGCSLKSACKS